MERSNIMGRGGPADILLPLKCLTSKSSLKKFFLDLVPRIIVAALLLNENLINYD